MSPRLSLPPFGFGGGVFSIGGEIGFTRTISCYFPSYSA
jgi:hypothetical protein